MLRQNTAKGKAEHGSAKDKAKDDDAGDRGGHDVASSDDQSAPAAVAGLEPDQLAEAVRPKLLKHASGVKTAEAVASGEADIGITLLPEMLPVKGVYPAAALPDALQKFTTYVAAVASNCTVPEAAAAFIRAAVDPDLAPAWRKAGIEPL